ncbi:MAG: hypothetical protein ABJZ55_24655 [Fuerstiella sp.]
MNISKWIDQAKELSTSTLSQALDVFGSGVGYVTSTLSSAMVFGSTEESSDYDHQKVDEKHYFLIPDRRTESKYSLYVMRCLPEGVPPINDLPKKRLFHLPNESALPTVEDILLTDARTAAQQCSADSTAISVRLNGVADEIDRLDGKLFNGALLIGGLVALVNPIAGAAVAVNALIPSLGMVLSKHGLKYAGDAVSSVEASRRIKAAEKDVLTQFRGAQTDSLVNPLLTQFDKAVETSTLEYEPILDFDPEDLNFGQLDQKRLLRLTCQAISNTYEEVLKDKKQWKQAQLGPEDIRFLKLLKQLAQLDHES